MLVGALLGACSGGEGDASGPSPGVASESPTESESSLAEESEGEETHFASGGMGVVPEASFATDDGRCEVRSALQREYVAAFNAVREGDQVLITNASGEIVATTEMRDLGGPVTGCLWMFTVDVPAGGRFYTATMGDWSSDAIPEPQSEEDRLRFSLTHPSAD